MKRIFAVFFFLLIPGLSYGGFSQGTVMNVFAYGDKVFFALSAGSAGAVTCGDGLVFWLSNADPNDKPKVALAVAAKITGKLVYVAGDSGPCISNPFNGGPSERAVGIDLKG